MNQNLIIMTKNLLFSGIVGTIVYYLLGWLVYGFLFPDLASGEESPLGILLGCLFYTFIYAVIFTRWANIATFKTGFYAGLTLGILYALSWYSFVYNGHFDLVHFIKEILIGGFMTAIMAGTVGFVNGKTN